MLDTPYIVRPASLHDQARVDELLARAYASLLAGAYEPRVLAAALPAMSRANPRLLECPTWCVAVDEDQRVVGCGGWTRAQPGLGDGDSEPDVGHVRHFATDVDHVRRGVGRLLGNHMLASARAAGIRLLECDSTLVAEGFYASLGFRRVEAMCVTMPVAGGGGTVEFPGVRMRLLLGGGG